MYKVIEGHENYLIESSGKVYRIRNGKIDVSKPLKEDLRNFYPSVKLDGHNYYIHKLVADAFVSRTREDRTLIFHIDGNKSNNAFTNLVWLTPSECQIASQVIIPYRASYIASNLLADH